MRTRNHVSGVLRPSASHRFRSLFTALYLPLVSCSSAEATRPEVGGSACHTLHDPAWRHAMRRWFARRRTPTFRIARYSRDGDGQGPFFEGAGAASAGGHL